MKPVVTQKEVAEALGVDISTVSKALKGNPAVAARTRARVSEMAERMGYRPDPMLRALARWREAQRGGRKAERAVLAWVFNHDPAASMERFAAYGEYLRGGRERAASLGYRVDPFWTGGGGAKEKRLGEILLARGIRGVIVAPQSQPDGKLVLPWESLCAVAIGYTLSDPVLHLVTNDHFQTMTQLLEILAAKGRRRVGVYMWEEDNRRVQRRAVSAFHAWSTQRRIPVLFYEKPRAPEFLEWVKKHRLDAVVARERAVKSWVAEVSGEIQTASYALDGGGDDLPGMDHNNAAIGAAAVDWVTRMVERNEFGLPEQPARLLLPGRWRE